MNCEEARMLLDAYIDGELTAEEMLALENHAKACNACAEEMKAALLLKDTLAHMDDELAVPLQAQAAWRNAVRAESKKKNSRKWLRGVYAAAAALIVVLGANFMLEAQDVPLSEAGMLEVMTANQPVVARDGGAGTAAHMADTAADYTVWKKISVSSSEEALRSVEMLAAEYSGECSIAEDGICRIALPYDYLDDFLKAASHIGEESYCEIMEQEGETAVVLLQLSE